MSDPVTIGLISMGATAVGGGIQAWGAYTGGRGQQAYYNYQANVQRNLARIANLKAGRDIMAGEVEAQKYGIQTAQTLGGTIARAGAGNISASAGSTAQVLQSQRAAGLEEQQVARQTAAERAYGMRVEAEAKTASAGALDVAGEQAAKAGQIAMLGDIASTAGSVAGKWYDISKTTPTTTPPTDSTVYTG